LQPDHTSGLGRRALLTDIHETRKAGFLAVKSSFRFLKEIPAYAAEKPGFLPSQAEDTFLPDFWFHGRYTTLRQATKKTSEVLATSEVFLQF